MDDKPLKKCPECGKNQLVKLVSAAGFRLKGSGWYETDFKSGAKKNLAGAGADQSSESGASKDSKSAGESKASGKNTSKNNKKEAGSSSKSA